MASSRKLEELVPNAGYSMNKSKAVTLGFARCRVGGFTSGTHDTY